jgi:hypothetical protein
MNRIPQIKIRFERSLLIAGLLIAFFSGLAVADTTGIVAGRIIDIASGKYIGNAKITLVGTNLHTYSDKSDGFYKIDNIPPGTYTMVASRGRYQSYSKERITIPKSSLMFIDFILKPDSGRVRGIAVESSRPVLNRDVYFPPPAYYGTIKGVVTEAQTGQPIPGAEVFLDSTNMNKTTTLWNGTFVIPNIRPGEYTLRVSSIGYDRFAIKGISIHNDSAMCFNISLPKAFDIHQYIFGLDSREKPVVDKAVNKITRLDSIEIDLLPYQSIVKVIKYLCD